MKIKHPLEYSVVLPHPPQHLHASEYPGKFKFSIYEPLYLSYTFSVHHQVLGQEISDFPLPDLSLVAENSDPTELGRLLQLILGCAVRCERKQGMLLFVYYT